MQQIEILMKNTEINKQKLINLKKETENLKQQFELIKNA